MEAKKRRGPRLDTATRIALDGDTAAAMRQQRGDGPTRERARMTGADRIDAGLLDSSKGAGCMVIRLRNASPVASLARRGLLTRRQMAAAERLVELYETAALERIGAQQWHMPVDGGGYRDGGQPNAVVQARADYARAVAAMPDASRRFVEAVVVSGRTVETAARDYPVLFRARSARWRTGEARAMLARGLDAVAGALGV